MGRSNWYPPALEHLRKKASPILKAKPYEANTAKCLHSVQREMSELAAFTISVTLSLQAFQLRRFVLGMGFYMVLAYKR